MKIPPQNWGEEAFTERISCREETVWPFDEMIVVVVVVVAVVAVVVVVAAAAAAVVVVVVFCYAFTVWFVNP